MLEQNDIYDRRFCLTDPHIAFCATHTLYLPFFPFISVPDVLCDPTDLIWRKCISFEAMTGRTALSSDGLLAAVFWGFPQL